MNSNEAGAGDKAMVCVEMGSKSDCQCSIVESDSEIGLKYENSNSHG